jgi:hypothetical protein
VNSTEGGVATGPADVITNGTLVELLVAMRFANKKARRSGL